MSSASKIKFELVTNFGTVLCLIDVLRKIFSILKFQYIDSKSAKKLSP